MHISYIVYKIIHFIYGPGLLCFFNVNPTAGLRAASYNIYFYDLPLLKKPCCIE